MVWFWWQAFEEPRCVACRESGRSCTLLVAGVFEEQYWLAFRGTNAESCGCIGRAKDQQLSHGMLVRH